jgi:hypothetical protein
MKEGWLLKFSRWPVAILNVELWLKKANLGAERQLSSSAAFVDL